MELSKIFKAYDVRGVYPDEFNEQAAERIGAAFARFSAAPAVALGRDMRLSSEGLSRAFAAGVTAQGANVWDLGLVSTDALYFAAGRHNLPGAMFTASHNPARYNGIKMCRAGAGPIGAETGLVEIRQMAEQGLSPAPEGGRLDRKDILGEFIDHLVSFLDPAGLKDLTVAADAGNGMAGKVLPLLFKRLPFDLVPLFFELDGRFPNHPADPIQVANLAALQKTVLEQGAQLGMAFDGDADRVFLVDEKAEPISGSLTAALVASRILAKQPGATVVYSVVTSRIVPETIRACGGVPVRSRVGHSFVKQVMAETGAVFGGEHSGHYYFRENFRADSGFICALLVLEALCAEDKPMSSVLSGYRRYWNSGEINSVVADQEEEMKKVAGAFGSGDLDWSDGLTVDFPQWWFNLRPSNTEPLLRLNVEAEDEDLGKQKTEKILAMIRG